MLVGRHNKVEFEMEREQLLKKRIAVLTGGKSAERQVSLRSGARIAASLKRLGADVVTIDPIDCDWVEQMRAASIEIAFLGVHGKGGEDGTLQGVLEAFDFGYTGSGVLASALAMNKVMTKRVLSTLNIPTPEYLAVDPNRNLDLQCEEAIDRLGLPLVIKPSSEGSSIGVSIISEPPEVRRIAHKTQHQFGEILFERYIQGQEVTVGLLGIQERLRALPILEIVPKGRFCDYEAKYNQGMTEFIIPARLSDSLTKQVQEIALRSHHAVGCWGVSRVDVLIDTNGQPYVTEINTLPGLTEISDLPAQAAAGGLSYDELIYEILTSAQVQVSSD